MTHFETLPTEMNLIIAKKLPDPTSFIEVCGLEEFEDEILNTPYRIKIEERVEEPKLAKNKLVEFYGSESVEFAMCDKWKSLTRIQFSDEVKKIGEMAFHCCSNLEFVDTCKVEEIGVAAFMYCYSIHTFLFRDGLKRIEDMAFHSCTELTTFTPVFLPRTVEYINAHAFYDTGDEDLPGPIYTDAKTEYDVEINLILLPRQEVY